VDSAGWDERYSGTDLLWGREPNRFVAEELADRPAGRALDLGAGEGRNALWLARLGWRVTAVDFSAVGIERGRSHAEAAGLAVDWVIADVLEYQPAPEEFDAVVVAYLHLPAADRARVLAHAAAGLAPGGLLVVVGHDQLILDPAVKGPSDPEVLYTPETISAELGQLTIVRAERVHRPCSAEPDASIAVDTLVTATRL
jgi:SAM-dependent methyltransferase